MRLNFVRKLTIMTLIITMGGLFGGAGPVLPASPPGPPPAEALQRLLEGNSRYVSDHPEHPHARPSAAPQRPIAVILTCSDARVPPEIVFDQGIGDLFVVRVAGNTYDRMLLETIAYGVEYGGARLVLVMGHDLCGAVTAAVKVYPDKHAGEMLQNIYPAVKNTTDAKGDRISAAISANAILVAAQLAAEPQLAPLVAKGKIKIAAARYDMTTGRVIILGDE